MSENALTEEPASPIIARAEPHVEAQTDQQSKQLVWAEMKPRIWAGVMSVLVLATLALTVAAMMSQAWWIAPLAAAAGTAFAWYEKEKAEKALLIKETHIGSHVESQAWAKNFGVEKGPEQQQVVGGPATDNLAPASPSLLSPDQLTENLLPPSQKKFTEKFTAPEIASAVTGEKIWTDLHPSKTGGSFATDIAEQAAVPASAFMKR